MKPIVATYAQALRMALEESLEHDEKVILLGEDIGIYGGIFTVTRSLIEKFGSDRVRDTPISEAAIVGAGIGMAMSGMHPVVEIMYEDFITICTDQIVNAAAKYRYMSDGAVSVPIVIRTQGGSGRGNAAQHSQSLEAWFAHIPGLSVVMPAFPDDAKGLLLSAIQSPNPVVFIEHKMLYFTKGLVETESAIPIGKARVVREGTDVTIIAYSWMILRVMEAADELAQHGISVEIVDLRTIRPLDKDAVLASARKTKRVLVVQEAPRSFGVGAELSSIIHENLFAELAKPVVRLGGSETPIPYSAELEKHAVPSKNEIEEAVKNLLQPAEMEGSST